MLGFANKSDYPHSDGGRRLGVGRAKLYSSGGAPVVAVLLATPPAP